jgi:hypothetical protein
MADLDKLLSSDIARAAAETVEPPDFASIDRRGVQRRRTRLALAGAVATIVVALLAIGTVRILDDKATDRLTPVGPPSPVTTTSPHWAGPLRDGSAMPVLSREDVGGGGESLWSDGRDASYGRIDITKVRAEPLRWTLDLRHAPPRSSTAARARPIIEYGIVVDADGDRDADCEIGINNDAPKAGDYRVWVRNLRNGRTAERVGGPYGYPFDFGHPDEQGVRPGDSRPMAFFFLADAPAPCNPFTDTASFYAWASVGDGQRVTAWDFAPDNGWFRMPYVP